MNKTTFSLLRLGMVAVLPLLTTVLVAQDTVPEQNDAPPAREQAAERDSATDDPSHQHPHEVYDELEVQGRLDDLVGIAGSAGEGVTGIEDLATRPLLRPGELVETTPGVIATQHSGGGKANQYFLRGFNLDHGTDFSVRVAGVPVNMPSHGHGQGYADLSFVIPDLVSEVRYRKGPYHASLGDFSAAGGVEMDFVRTLEGPMVSITGGSNDVGRLLWADHATVAGGDLLAALSVFHDDGPWRRGNDFDGWKGLLRYARGDTADGFSVTAMAYDANWLSTDQVPRRAVDGGLIDRFDLIDPGPRGESQRLSLSAERHHGTDTTYTRLGGFLLYSDFGLVSNFTYQLEDPINGDQFAQADERVAAGFDLSRIWIHTWRGRDLETTAGLQARYDDIENGLFGTRERVRIGTVRQDDIRQVVGGPYVETLVRWSPKLRSRLGLRVDGYHADVDSDLLINSGSADDLLVSPKLSFIFGPWHQTELYVNYGHGFHSNDARGATLRVDPTNGDAADPVDPLVRARGIDLGVRTTAWRGLHSTITLFALELDSELVFVGDGGATEASRPSRRLGIEWTNAYQLNERWKMDLDATWTDSTFTDDAPEGDDIPGAIGTTIAAGVAYESPRGFSTGVRWRYFGDVPLIEDGSARWDSSSLVNAQVGYRFTPRLHVAVEVFNLFDRADSDIEYFYASRLPGEPAGGIEDVHFHPFEGRSARLIFTWRGVRAPAP